MTTTHGGWENGATSQVLTGDPGPDVGWSLVPVTLADGRTVLFGIGDSVICRWDPADGTEAGPPIFSTERIWRVNQFVDTAGKVWLMVTYRAHTGPVTGIRFLDPITGSESRSPIMAQS